MPRSCFASHHWPTWGNARIVEYLKKQRDTYKYIHDQTLRLANQGWTPREIAEVLELRSRCAPASPTAATTARCATTPRPSTSGTSAGTTETRLSSIRCRLRSPRQSMWPSWADPSRCCARRRNPSTTAEYRWAATVLDHLVFAEPENQQARELLARSYEQLGYQAESGPWRDVYLSAAYELRHGGPETSFSLSAATDLLARTPMERFLEALATRVNGPKADGKHMTINFVLPDVDESYVLTLENAVLHHERRDPDPDAGVTIRVTRELLVGLFGGQVGGARAGLLRRAGRGRQPHGPAGLPAPAGPAGSDLPDRDPLAQSREARDRVALHRRAQLGTDPRG